MKALPETPLQRIRAHLVGLKMSCALEALDAGVRKLEDGQCSALEFLDELLGEEHATRETRRIKSSLMTARLTRIKTLEGFDFSFQPSLDKNRILALVELCFIERREVVHLLGPPGTGKSHLAIALGVEAVKAGKSVYFATLAEIIDSLKAAEREGRLAQRIAFIARPALLIIDEVGYLPVQKGGANLFFQLINARYERGAVILTSNRGFSEWGEVFGDTVVAAALLDRLLHHAIVIEIAGNSYRLREHAKLVPENLRLPPISAPPAVKIRRGRPAKHGGNANDDR
jgi:DNA replication protein DnaC